MREIDIRLAFDVVKMPCGSGRDRPEQDLGVGRRPAAAVPVEAKAQQPPWLHFDTVNRDPEEQRLPPVPLPTRFGLKLEPRQDAASGPGGISRHNRSADAWLGPSQPVESQLYPSRPPCHDPCRTRLIQPDMVPDGARG